MGNQSRLKMKKQMESNKKKAQKARNLNAKYFTHEKIERFKN